MFRLCAFALICLSSCSLVCAAEPVKLIFDTDIGNDVDDAMAMGVIHSLQSRKQCELLAVTITKDHPDAAPYIDAINTFYGRPDIPIGVVRDGKTREAGKFLPLCHVKDGDTLRYPHDLTSGQDAPEAVALLRKILAAQPDESVVIAQVGFSTNLARLLDSPADAASPLTGLELAKQKVKLLSVMAGAFRPINGNAHFCEYNVVEDKASVKELVKRWPTEIVFSGFEIGIAVAYPSESILKDYGYVAHHPIAESYILYSPPPKNRPTWDLTSVLYGVFPDRGYFELSPAGTVSVEDDGFTRFDESPTGKHHYLILPDQQIERVREALVQLSSQPPSK
ncbi:MAG: nucleoside hydrolase [Planctomycetaceae bacterium]